MLTLGWFQAEAQERRHVCARPILPQARPCPGCHVTLSRVPCAVQEVEGPMLGDDSFVFHLLFFLLPYHGSYSLQYRVERL